MLRYNIDKENVIAKTEVKIMGKKIFGFIKGFITFVSFICIVILTLYVISVIMNRYAEDVTTVIESTPAEAVALVEAAKDTAAEKPVIPTLPEKTVLKISTVERKLEAAGELVTLRDEYVGGGEKKDYKKAWGFKVPGTTDQIVYTYEGCICAGINVEEVTVSVDNDKKTITISLPEPYIISNELYEDKFKTWDIKNSVFNSSSLAEYGKLAESIKTQEQEELLNEEGFSEKVRENAESVFRLLLSTSEETSEYEVIFT